MTGDEIITISIQNKYKKASISYGILQADFFKITKGEFHLMELDRLIEKFNNDNDTIKRDEIITISIQNKNKQFSTTYDISQADSFNGTKGEFHLMQLDKLVEKFINNNDTIKQILEPHVEAIKNCEGVFPPNSLALDCSLDHYHNGFCLWLGSGESIEIDFPMNIENASMIQSVVRDLGREVTHTWAQQYSINPQY